MGQQSHWMLIIRDESNASFTVMLASGEKVVVGRSRSCEIILKDQAVSRKHCFFGVGEDGVLKLVDLGAQHPTSLNGVAIKAGCVCPLQDGSEVRLGRGSVIKVECLSGNLSDKVGQVDPMADDDLETHTAVLEQPVSAEVEEVGPGDDPLNNGNAHCSGNKKSNDPDIGILHTDGLQPAASKRDDERNENNDTLEDKSPSSAPRNSSDLQDETSLVNVKGVIRQSRPDRLNSSKAGEGNSDIDEETRLNNVDALKRLDVKKGNRSAPQAEVNQNHTQVLGQTLQGKLTHLKEGKPVSVSNNPSSEGSDDGVLNGDVEAMTRLSGGDELDETNFVDPVELQKLMNGKSGPSTKKGGRKGFASGEASGNGVEAEGANSTDGDPQDETNYVDPAELQRLMKGKSGSFGKKGRKTGTVPKQPSRTGNEAEQTALSDGDSQDETNFIDPAELQKLMKGKSGSFGKKGRKTGKVPKQPSRTGNEAEQTALSDGDSQDETNFIDPAELQKLMKGKAGSFGKKGRKTGTVPKQPSRTGDKAEKTGSNDGDSQDETNFIDPAELQKLMKGKAGSFGKKGRKTGTVPKQPSRTGDKAEKTGSDDGDSQDETNFIDPAELQKLMKGKAKSPRSNKGRFR